MILQSSLSDSQRIVQCLPKSKVVFGPWSPACKAFCSRSMRSIIWLWAEGLTIHVGKKVVGRPRVAKLNCTTEAAGEKRRHQETDMNGDSKMFYPFLSKFLSHRNTEPKEVFSIYMSYPYL